MRCLNVVEGEEFSLPRDEASRLRDAAERLRVRLRPSFSLLTERAGVFRLFNVIGTIDLGEGLVVQVAPKLETDADWATAVVSLLTGDEGIDLAGERKAGTAQTHNKLLDAIAGIYLSRLERAYRQEGPLVLMERREAELPNLLGKLNVSRWARTALWRPHVFPVTRTQLAEDNPFTRALVHVADLLAHTCSTSAVRNGLRSISRDLGAGLPHRPGVAGGISNRTLPEQWNAYKPAWSLATAILNRTSLLGPIGHHTGVGLAVEAWPLLETLLGRTLAELTRIGASDGRSMEYLIHGEVELLKPRGPKPQLSFSPEPDGRLWEHNCLVASFEAKYSAFDGTSPPREHVYQAVATAAACGAPVAVLCYPGKFAPLTWDVSGLQQTPRCLVAFGLDMFRWLPPARQRERAEALLQSINGASSSALPKVAVQ